MRGIQAITLQFNFQTDVQIRDVKFIDDEEIMLLVKANGTICSPHMHHMRLTSSRTITPYHYAISRRIQLVTRVSRSLQTT
jgi:hypothetical protein